MKPFRIALGAAILSFSSGVLAEEPENYIKYRQAMMKAIAGHTSAASQIVRGKVAPDGDLVIHASALAELNRNIPRLFPEGSDFGETGAKDAVWEDRAGFEKAAEAARTATADFAAAAAGGDPRQIANAFKAVGKSCKGCHKDFRQKDE